MKNLFVFIILPLLTCCSLAKKQKWTPILDDKLIGEWKLSNQSGSDGVNSYLTNVPESLRKSLIFYKSGKLSGTYFENAKRFNVITPEGFVGQKLFAIIIEGKCVALYSYKFSKNKLLISPYPVYCDEGCTDYFTKVQ